jgi:phosphoribosylformylglycinamidine synthase
VLPPLAARGDITLFGESCGNVLATCAPGQRAELEGICARHGVALSEIGTLGGERVAIRAGAHAIEIAVSAAQASYDEALPRAMEAR